MHPMINAESLVRLDERLRALLNAELAAGNEVGSAADWLYFNVEVLVVMRQPFIAKRPALPDGVRYEESRDHWIASGTICDYICDVAAHTGRETDGKYLHVLRSVRPMGKRL